MSNEASGYGKMHCYNRMTGKSVGYMGATWDNYVSLVANEAEAAKVQWETHRGDVYLGKGTNPDDRYLAVSVREYAGWDLWANVNLKPVVLNGDGTVSLKEDPTRKLYGPYRSMGVDYVCWTESHDSNNSNILVCKLEG